MEAVVRGTISDGVEQADEGGRSDHYAVSIRPMTDAFKCRLFAITLKDKARDWFHQLPAGSIYGFEDLSRSFQLRFSTSKKRKKNPESIFLIKQKADESLAQYVDRFQEEILDIQEVPGFALQMAFTVGLREGFFKMSLTRKAPLSFEGLMEKAAKEIAMEAANPAFAKKLARLTEVESREPGGARQQEGRRREEPRGPAQQELSWRQPEGPVQGQWRGLPPGGRNYYHGGAGRLPQLGWRQGPRPLPPPPQQAMAIGRGRVRGRERGRGGAGAGRRRNHQEGRQEGEVAIPFCDFHEEEGHATATCPEFLELKGRRGAGEQQPPARIVEMTGVGEEDRCVDRSDVGDRGGIGVIHGGVGIEATRKASLHTMYRRGVASTSQAPPPDEKITFSRKDLPDHEDPFCDALVIRTAIEGFTVSRILVDNGSSVNVIFKKAFNEMRVEARRVLAADGPLFGFSGERKEVEGGVGLQVTLGGLSRNCRFVIVDAPSSYNAIFGRPLISAFRCVPSSFHQCLKLNSGGTQIRVRGDPKAARECYVTAVNAISWRGDAEELERRLEREEQEESRVEEWGGGIAEEPVMAGESRVGREGGEESRVEEWGGGIAEEPVMAGESRVGREGGEESRVEEWGGGIAEEPVMAGELRVGGEGKEERGKKRKIGEVEEMDQPNIDYKFRVEVKDNMDAIVSGPSCAAEEDSPMYYVCGEAMKKKEEREEKHWLGLKATRNEELKPEGLRRKLWVVNRLNKIEPSSAPTMKFIRVSWWLLVLGSLVDVIFSGESCADAWIEKEPRHLSHGSRPFPHRAPAPVRPSPDPSFPCNPRAPPTPPAPPPPLVAASACFPTSSCSSSLPLADGSRRSNPRAGYLLSPISGGR
ncbi:hypothetical protein KSP39_PZI007200 [Platanthera zijinensis]|uniref:Retrotransposon gag domain-containing protein n=1 Tax=Platanthera zijinensis TaxID=2320716 RepID=A0AAP0BQ04_9ASPA